MGKKSTLLGRGKINPFWVGKKSTKIREEIQMITGRGERVGRPGHPLWYKCILPSERLPYASCL